MVVSVEFVGCRFLLLVRNLGESEKNRFNLKNQKQKKLEGEREREKKPKYFNKPNEIVSNGTTQKFSHFNLPKKLTTFSWF